VNSDNAMKFIHSADFHLDSPLRGLERYEEAPVHELRGGTRRAFENLVKLAVDEEVAFVLVAGDIYDGDWRDYNTGLFFVRQMNRLRDAGVQVFLIRGNHDAASQITKELTLPDNVKEFSMRRPSTIILEDLGVAVHGQSFPSRSVAEDLSAGYPLPLAGLVNIGLLHTSADGREGHEDYAPCTLAGLVSKRYDYWALGHVHQREIMSQDPWVVFAGNIQGRHARETGVKGCTIVAAEDGCIRQVEHRALDVVRWEQCLVDASQASDAGEVLERVQGALLSASDNAEGRLLAARVVVSGACRAHSMLSNHYERFLADCRAVANDIGSSRVWVEKVRLLTCTEAQLDQIAGSYPLSDLMRFIRELRGNEPELLKLLEGFKDLKQKLPVELISGPDAIRLDLQTCGGLLEEAEQVLLPLLLEQESSR
jgi:DNA repair exonuclease SbcCD nuclease subunit